MIKNRNYDPESRTLKKRTREDDVSMQDTVEKDVQGLAQQIILEDEQRRAQELVNISITGYSRSLNTNFYRTFLTSRLSDLTGI